MINAKVDSVVYEGIEKITTGGKTVELSEVYSGSQSIVENGTYDIGGKAQVVVNVPTESVGGNEPTGSINITTNGTHDVADYAQAVVNVPQEGYNVDDMVKGSGANQSHALFYKAENVETNVTDIRDYAFASLKMYKVTAPNVAKIYQGAFSNCWYLTEVVAPNLTYLGADAFKGSGALARADYPLLAETNQINQFNGCSSLAEINMPLLPKVTENMFYNCKALVSANLPSATDIGKSSFYGCTSLSSVNFPLAKGVGQSAFYGCTSLTEITLPNVTGLAAATIFSGCTALKKVDFGDAMNSIKGTNQFQNCTALETVILRYNGVVQVNNGAFNASTNGVTVYVLSAQIAAYQADSVWSTQSKVTFAAIEGSDYE